MNSKWRAHQFVWYHNLTCVRLGISQDIMRQRNNLIKANYLFIGQNCVLLSPAPPSGHMTRGGLSIRAIGATPCIEKRKKIAPDISAISF